MSKKMSKKNGGFKVPVVDVTSENLPELQPRICQDLEAADFVAIDCVSLISIKGDPFIVVIMNKFNGRAVLRCF